MAGVAQAPMKFYRLAPAAEQDIFEIWAYIAAQNERAADDLETDILNGCARVAQRPDLGHFRRDLTNRNVRFFPVRSVCVIIYNPDSDPIRVLRVLHGARDAKNQLKDVSDD
jgi:plasmid stabilization system protein ParE